MKNIHVLPTDKPSRLFYDKILQILETPYLMKYSQNIYITNDEEIKKGDWFLQTTYEGVFKCSNVKTEYIYFDRDSYEPITYCRKIILTTDQDLIADGVQPIDDEFLEWFVKNPSCEFVEIDNRLKISSTQKGFVMDNPNYKKIIIPKEEQTKVGIDWSGFPKSTQEQVGYAEPKQETLEEACEKYFNKVSPNICFYDAAKFGAKWQQQQNKNLYSEEEVKAMLLIKHDGLSPEYVLQQFKKQ